METIKSKYIPVIGMEVHIELKTKSKMFCDSKNGLGLEKEPNIHICPICTGQPGTLPVPNRQAIEFVQLMGLALNCEIAKESKFDRKNYFYPDLPKGYQISQYDQPLCKSGKLEVESGKTIGITRIHLEEDTGKLIHPAGADYTLVDFNRAGVPLMELVTEPDFQSGAEARIFCQKLQQICRYLGISDADMEKGNMRCEANVSLYKEGKDKLSGVKVEVKNINSFKFVEKAINYEIERQTELLENGKKVVQETRGYDSSKNITISQRTKESAHDYRYFPEPDIPPMKFDNGYINKLKSKLPEFPDAKTKRFQEQYNLASDNANIIVNEKQLADYFECVVSEIREKIKSKEIASDEIKVVKLAANYFITELRKYLLETKQSMETFKVTAENFAELMGIIADGKISSSAAQAVLYEMIKTGGDPSHIIEEKNLLQISDERGLETAVNKVIDNNPKSVEDYKKGKENALQFMVGQIMKETKGKANPQIVAELLRKKLR